MCLFRDSAKLEARVRKNAFVEKISDSVRIARNWGKEVFWGILGQKMFFKTFLLFEKLFRELF